MAISTGHGASLTFASNTVSIVSISGFEQTREAVDTSHLGTTDYRTKIPGDLTEPGEFTIEYLFDPEEVWDNTDANAEAPIEAADTASSCTITFPVTVTGQTAATWSANAFLTSWSSPELVTDGLMTASATIQWADGPAWTDETA